jgi:hypothetical protein
MVEGQTCAVRGFVKVCNRVEVASSHSGIEDEVSIGLGNTGPIVYDDKSTIAA